MPDPSLEAARLFVFVRLHAQAGRESEVVKALRAVITGSRTEAGCVAINAFRSTTDQRLFFIHSRWRDENAFDLHAEFPHTRAFIAAVDALLDEPRVITRTVILTED